MKLRINYRVRDERLVLMRAAAEVMQMSVRQFAVEAPVILARQIAEQIVDEQLAAAEEVVEEVSNGTDSSQTRPDQTPNGTAESDSDGTNS